MMRSPARICTTAQDRSLAVAPGGGVLFPPAVSALSLGGAASSMVRSIPDFIESGQICACDNCNYRGLGCTKHFHGRLRYALPDIKCHCATTSRPFNARLDCKVGPADRRSEGRSVGKECVRR